MASSTTPLRYVECVIQDPTGDSYSFINDKSLGLRIDFSVVSKAQAFKGGFNTAQIRIYNLSDSIFKFIKPADLNQSTRFIRLVAGNRNIKYSNQAIIDDTEVTVVQDGITGTLFEGYIYSAIRSKEGTDIVTILYCSTNDGTKTNFFNIAYKKVSLNQILKDIATKLELTLDADNFAVDFVDYSFSNNAFAVLDELACNYNLLWSVFGTKLIVRDINTKGNIFEFDKSSGLLKPPIYTEKGVDLEVMLNPLIRPNDTFILNSDFGTFNLGALEFSDRTSDKTQGGFLREGAALNYYGEYECLFLTHNGSTHTNIWNTRIEGMTPS